MKLCIFMAVVCLIVCSSQTALNAQIKTSEIPDSFELTLSEQKVIERIKILYPKTEGVSQAEWESLVNSLTEAYRRSKKRDWDQWPYRRLSKESTHVIIARYLDGEREVNNLTDVENDFCRSRLRVLSVVKGEFVLDILVVRHLKTPVAGTHGFENLTSSLLISDGNPVFVNGDVVKYLPPIVSTRIVPEYLLFLRKVDNELFEPISGFEKQNYSVRILND